MIYGVIILNLVDERVVMLLQRLASKVSTKFIDQEPSFWLVAVEHLEIESKIFLPTKESVFANYSGVLNVMLEEKKTDCSSTSTICPLWFSILLKSAKKLSI